ncbi:MAG: hypothetical protein NZM42_15065, partial [Gemmatales bacterium]|nr:hypothetical protein [Gemmatales bacterium]
MKLNLRFDEHDWERIAHDWSAWWEGDLKRPMIVLECIERRNAYDPHCAATFLSNYALDAPIEPILDQFVPRLENTHWLGDSFPRFWPNFGPGIVAAFTGKVDVRPAWDTTWFTPRQVVPITDLHVEAEADNPWQQRVETITRAAVERWGNQLAIGLTDLGGNLDILASLRDTKQLLIDLVKAPDEIDRLVSETTRLWLDCFDRLCRIIEPVGRGVSCWGPLWSPGRGYMLQSDFAYMISPK